jgi:hypothetical protein
MRELTFEDFNGRNQGELAMRQLASEELDQVSGGVSEITILGMTITGIPEGLALMAVGGALIGAFSAGYLVGTALYNAGTYLYYDVDWS